MTPASFYPTEYTAALLLQLRRRAQQVQGAQVLEIGTGSGVVLASLLAAGANAAMGVDLEPAAVTCTQALLEEQGCSARAQLMQGDMWTPCAGRVFDLIATNLPQFPVQHPLDDGRLPSWSCAGPDGRAAIDPFLRGLPQHLAAGGLVVMTHNAFVDLELTQRTLLALGLVGSIARTVCVPLSPQKLDGLHPKVLARYEGHGLHRVGDYAFADFHILEIRHAALNGAAS